MNSNEESAREIAKVLGEGGIVARDGQTVLIDGATGKPLFKKQTDALALATLELGVAAGKAGEEMTALAKAVGLTTAHTPRSRSQRYHTPNIIDAATKAKRRAKSKAARKARKKNRR